MRASRLSGTGKMIFLTLEHMLRKKYDCITLHMMLVQKQNIYEAGPVPQQAMHLVVFHSLMFNENCFFYLKCALIL